MFGMGFTEIIIIVIIAILFLGPDKLPSAMVDIAKFFRNMKKTVSSVKETIEEEMNVSEIKEEALAYKKELLDAKTDIDRVSNLSNIGDLADLADDLLDEKPKTTQDKPRVESYKETQPQHKEEIDEIITFPKKSKKEEPINV